MTDRLTAAITSERIRSGLHRLVGIVCQCGGELRAEKFGLKGAFRWEVFCTKCKTCDPNGHPTLAACLIESPEFWGHHAE